MAARYAVTRRKAAGYWVFQADLGLNSLGTSSGTGPLLKLNSTLPPGSVVVAFLETSTGHASSDSHQLTRADDEMSDSDHGNNNAQGNDDDQGKGKNGNSFTATANSSALFEMAASGSNGQPGAQPGAGGSGNVSSGGRGVPEPGTATLLLTALLGFGMRLLPWRTASRLMVPPRQQRGN